MPAYIIGMARTYLITIEAEDPESAKKLAERFIGETDLSTPFDKSEYRFAIEKIELLENDVFECDNV